MKRAFYYKDDKSDKFWCIDYSECDIAVNYGKTGTSGKYELKEFASEEECLKQAEKLIAQKIKKGYSETNEFDYINHYYFDDYEEMGLHAKTSHPHFAKHFTESFYYDCGDEEAPFGSDEGSDALALMSEKLRKKGNLDFADFPRHIIEYEWNMKYIPAVTLDEDEIKKLIKIDEMNMTQSDMITYAVAFGQIKLTGKLDPTLKQRAIQSMKRIKITAKLMQWGENSLVLDKMISDIASFK